MINVSSFDIFDTCLTRTFAHPADLFLEVGEVAGKKGWIAQTPHIFFARRVEAEKAARRLTPSGEVSLEEIYRVLGADLDLNAETLLQIQNLELLHEEEALQPIDETLHRITQARQQGRQILFLSDMYLPGEFLERVLRKHGFFADGDFLYVSGEVGRHKGDGGLFQHARALLKDNVSEWIHYGDNMRADVVSPRRLGLTGEHFESGLLNRYELSLCPQDPFLKKVALRLLKITRLERWKGTASFLQSKPREKWKSRVAAAMRLARLSKPPGLTPREKVIWDTGASVAGPIVYGYVKWVLDQASRQGLPRVHFVARDGQIMLKIAEIIQSVQPSSIECRYLYGSRHAWVPPSMGELDDSHHRWIFEPTPGLCLSRVFSRLEVAPENHRSLLETNGFAETAWEQPLTAPQLTQLAVLLREPSLSKDIVAAAAIKRESVLEYLRKEGLFEQKEIAMVDLGGNGSLKKALAAICELAPDPIKPKVLGFYYVLMRNPQLMGKNFYGYINSLHPSFLAAVRYYCTFFEFFTAADHGQTRGYRHGEVILASPDNPAVTDWGLPVLQAGMLAFSRAYAAHDDGTADPEEFLAATMGMMKLFFEKPTIGEVEAWGSFPFSDQRVEIDLLTILPSWKGREIFSALMTREGRNRLSWWMPGLAKREGMTSLMLYYRLHKIVRTYLKPRP